MKPKEFDDFWKEEAEKVKEANQKEQGEKVQNKKLDTKMDIISNSQLRNK